MCKFCTLKAIENSKKKTNESIMFMSPKLIYKYDSQAEFQQVFLFFSRNWHAESNLNRIEKDLDYPKQFLEKKNMPTTWYPRLTTKLQW